MWYEDQIDSLDEMRQETERRTIMQATEQPEVPTALEQAGAAFELFNPITSWIVQEPLPNVLPVEGYNPIDDLEGYEKYSPAFMDSRSPETTKILKNRIDRQNRNQEIINNGDWVSTASIVAASVGDPFNAALMLMPGAALITKGKPLISVMKSASLGLAATGLSEVALHQTQEARTLEESAVNMAATVLFDGILGGIAGVMTKSESDVLISQIEDQIRPLHASAAQTTVASGAELKEVTPFFKFTGLGYLGNTMAKITPSGRLFQSKNEGVRATAQALLETSAEVAGDELPTAVETLVKLDRAHAEEKVLNVRQLQRDSGLNNETFSIELDNALRNGDIHTNKAVEQSAKLLRQEVDKHFNKAAGLKIKGTFNEETGEVLTTNTSQSYWTRRHDLAKIRKNPEAYRAAWKKGLIDAAVSEGRAIPEDIDEIVSDIYFKISKMNDGDIQGVAINPTVTKSRANVKDEFLDEFLVKDWESLFDSYINSMSSRVRLAERFGADEGDFMMKGHIETIRDRYQAAHRQAENAGKTKQAGEIKKAMESDIHDIEAMRDTLLGNYRGMGDVHPENRGVITALRTARSLNVASMLNSVLISSLPDLARVITAHGAKNYSKALARSISSIGLEKLPKDQLGKMASAADRASSMRLQQIADIDDGMPLSKVEQGARYVSDKALTFSGLKHLNALNKTMVGIMSGDKIASTVMKGGGSKLLKRLGVNSDEVAEQIKKYARKEEDGMYTLNVDRWDNHAAAESIEAAIIKEADKIVLTPGIGDKPLLMHGEVAKTIFQFKNFILAATNRLLIPLMQEQGARKWVEIYSLMSMGAMSYYAGAFFAGREPSDDPAVILKESIDRAGLAGYAMEMVNISLKLAGDPFAGNTRYRSRDKLGAVLGPTAGTFSQIMKVTDTGANADTRLHAMRRLMPLQNHFLLRRGIDEIEGEVAKALGGTGKYGKSKDRGKAVSF